MTVSGKGEIKLNDCATFLFDWNQLLPHNPSQSKK